MKIKNILFTEFILQDRDIHRLATLFEVMNGYSVISEFPFRFRWKMISKGIFKDLLKVDCGKVDSITNIEKHFQDIAKIVTKEIDKGNDNYLILIAYEILFNDYLPN